MVLSELIESFPTLIVAFTALILFIFDPYFPSKNYPTSRSLNALRTTHMIGDISLIQEKTVNFLSANDAPQYSRVFEQNFVDHVISLDDNVT